jgi:Dolichyl-phosphate-mannose-protein mannosyltransferase
VSPAVAVVVTLALLTLCGLGALAVLGVARTPRELLRRSGLAPLAGMALSGVVAATLATAGSGLGIAGLVVLTVATCAGGAVRLTRSPAPADAPPPVERSPLRWLDALVVTASLGVIAIVGAVAVAAFHVTPIVEYDSWAMWGMKARAIATIGSAHPDVFATPEAYGRLHIEYPLLLPALHALPLQTAGEFSSNIVILSCLALGLAGLLGLWALFRDRVRPVILLPAIAAIAAAPAFFVELGAGYADVPLAVFVAAGVAAAARWLVDRDTSWLALATLFFSAGVLTKNEGLLFAAAAYVSLLVVASGRRRAVAFAALVCALAFAPWRIFMEIHDLGSPAYDLSRSFDLPWVAGRLDRAPVAADALLHEARNPNQFGMLLVLGVAASALAFLFAPRSLALFAAGFALLSFAGLTWIYVLTPEEIEFFLSTNADRVVVGLVFGLAALTPLLFEESVRGRESRAGDADSRYGEAAPAQESGAMRRSMRQSDP